MNPFIDYQCEFNKLFREDLRKRFFTMKLALNLVAQLPWPPMILETGCMRHEGYSEGASTFVFGYAAYFLGGQLVTIDLERDNLEFARTKTEPFAKNINYFLGNSLEVLPRVVKEITEDGTVDLFYPDSLDCPETGDATESQQHNLAEVKLVEPFMKERSVILLDDNDMANGGKTRLTKDYLTDRNWRCLFDDVQSVWMK